MLVLAVQEGGVYAAPHDIAGPAAVSYVQGLKDVEAL